MSASVPSSPRRLNPSHPTDLGFWMFLGGEDWTWAAATQLAGLQDLGRVGNRLQSFSRCVSTFILKHAVPKICLEDMYNTASTHPSGLP